MSLSHRFLPRRPRAELLLFAVAFQVVEIPSSREIVIGPKTSPGGRSEVTEERSLEEGDLLVIRDDRSDEETSILGHARVTREAGTPGLWKASVLSHSQNGLIRTGDSVERLDLSGSRDSLATAGAGRMDLLVRDRRRISAKFKPMVYQGVTIGQTAFTLAEREIILDPATNVFFGLTDRWMLSSLVASNFFGLLNLGAKYKIADSEFMTLSAEITALLPLSAPVSTQGWGKVYLSLPSNGKFASHTTLTIAYQPGPAVAGPSSTLIKANPILQSSIQSGAEYILDNWNRILFGPRYGFEEKAVGGYFAYVFVWQNFYLTLDLSIGNVTNFSLSSAGYFPHFYLFWRY